MLSPINIDSETSEYCVKMDTFQLSTILGRKRRGKWKNLLKYFAEIRVKQFFLIIQLLHPNIFLAKNPGKVVGQSAEPLAVSARLQFAVVSARAMAVLFLR